MLKSGKIWLLSSRYILSAIPHWRRLPKQSVRLALSFALASAGKSIAARIAMMAITTSSSINVNPRLAFLFMP